MQFVASCNIRASVPLNNSNNVLRNSYSSSVRKIREYTRASLCGKWG